ncbi:phage terminase small subunit-related protein [Bacillus cereus]|uniref:phage terminase small subunit-related protein n=1 Tax=Bacillus sp. RB3 TaxID=3050012 RepID=UPI00254097F3|nr:phage terminase small subunit-related protein [Bacillus sp. RB3]MDK3010871.1 phage terminase small subunit-related protein [Bacillus sp. RB3]MDZ4444511.1 phage terminase small subunit-related protein [Bacillus cereus]
MARARSEKSYAAYEIWKRANGKILLKDIAKEIGVSESQIRKWKYYYKWNEQRECLNVDGKKSENNIQEDNKKTLYLQVLNVVTTAIKSDDVSIESKLKACDLLVKLMEDQGLGRKINKIERRVNLYLGDSISNEQWEECKTYFRNEDNESCCAYCGDVADSLEKEHIISVDKGGTYSINNIIPACSRCNRTKNNQDLNDWFRSQPFFHQNRLDKIVEYQRISSEKYID